MQKWPGRGGSILFPASGRSLPGARHFEQDGELRGIGVLRFVQDDDRIESLRMRRAASGCAEVRRQRDLVRIGDDAALEAKVPIIALHLGAATQRAGLIHPAAQRNKALLPSQVDKPCLS